MASAYAKLEDYDNAKLFYEKSLTEHRTPETVSKLSDVEKVIKGLCLKETENDQKLSTEIRVIEGDTH